VHPQRKFSIILIASLGLWYPTLRGVLDGNQMSVPETCGRYLICFFVARVLVGIVAGLYDSYAEAVARAEEEERLAAEAAAEEEEERAASARADAATEALFGSD
jgi:hypothetical protein